MNRQMTIEKMKDMRLHGMSEISDLQDLLQMLN